MSDCSLRCGSLCHMQSEQLHAEKCAHAVTWRDEQGDARVPQYQAAAPVIHLSSRKHQQLVHQLTGDGLALGGRVQFLVEGSHLRQVGRWVLVWGLIFR